MRKNVGRAVILGAGILFAGAIALPQIAHACSSYSACTNGGPGGGTVGAPEFDPAWAVEALTILSGTLVVVRGRKKGGKKK